MTLTEDDLARLLLVRACEDSDPKGSFLPHAAREKASRGTLASREDAADDPAHDLLLRRASPLLERLEREQPVLGAARRLVSRRAPIALFAVLGLGLGLALDALGKERHINLLAFPLLGLLAWNFAAYASQLLGAVVLRSPAAGRGLARWIAGTGLWWASRRQLLTQAGDSHAARFASRSLGRFAQLWMERAGALQLARVRCRLHVGAMALCLGVVAGMYFSGFAYAYRASWESTFLDANSVRCILVGVLGPASALLGVPLPSVSEIEALRAPMSGAAATWIHLWALTAVLFIGIPRTLLALREGWLAGRRSAGLDVDLEDPYFLRLLSALRGGDQEVNVLPYSTELSNRASASLRGLLYEVFGNRARIRFAPPVPYGAPPPEAHMAKGVPHCTAVIFNLAQSPEQEVHGRFLEECKLCLEARPGRASLLVFVDEERYRSTQSEERAQERLQSWGRMLREVDLAVARFSQPSQEAEVDPLVLARRALWPPPSEAVS